MKDIINLFDSETRAMAHVQMELYDMLVTKPSYSKNEEKIKAVLIEGLCSMIDSVTAIQELVSKLKELDEFDLMHGDDFDEIVRGEK